MNQSADDKPEIHSFRLDELSPATYNPRTISDESMEGLRSSIQRFNCVQLIIVNTRDEKNVIVGGHQRYRALMDLKGDDHQVDCVTVDLDDEEERLLNIALNNPEIQGEFDIGKLAESVKEIRERMPDDAGLIELRIEKLLQEISAVGEDISSHWNGMPEFQQEDKTSFRDMIIHFQDQAAVDNFERLVQQTITDKTRYLWYPKQENMDTSNRSYGGEDES
jgi:hypothetical protein